MLRAWLRWFTNVFAGFKLLHPYRRPVAESVTLLGHVRMVLGAPGLLLGRPRLGSRLDPLLLAAD